MLKCPHCNERSISISNVLFTRTARAKHCSKCQKTWRVSKTALCLASFSSVISVQVALSFDVHFLPTLVLGLLIGGCCYYFYPLSKMEVSK
jgi:hypothetical protein